MTSALKAFPHLRPSRARVFGPGHGLYGERRPLGEIHLAAGDLMFLTPGKVIPYVAPSDGRCLVTNLYTKNGKPMRRVGDDLYNASGRHVGRFRGDKVYDLNGRYAATLVGDRLVYRSTHSASVSGAVARRASRAGSAAAPRAASAMWGTEPDFT